MPDQPSHITRLDSVSADDARIDAILSMRQSLSIDPQARFRYRWPLVARQNQTPPTDSGQHGCSSQTAQTG